MFGIINDRKFERKYVYKTQQLSIFLILKILNNLIIKFVHIVIIIMW